MSDQTTEQDPGPETATYTLQSSKLRYAHAGEMVDADLIELRAPSAKHADECAFLYEAVRGAFDAQRKSLSDEEIEEAQAQAAEIQAEGKGLGDMDPHAMMIVLADSPKPLADIIQNVRQLCTHKALGLAYVDGEERVTTPLWESLSWVDVQGVVGTFCARFIAASLTPSETSSGAS